MLDWIKPGALATWLHTPRGGYGYAMPVDAEILALHGKTCTIEVARWDGQRVRRRVSITNLSPRKAVMKYIIRYDLAPKSYFRQMTGIGPAFGATREQSPRFDSEREAGNVIAGFPIVASVCCEIEVVKS